MSLSQEWRGLSAEELQKQLGELKKELLKLNVSVAAGAHPANPGKLRQTKKNIARLSQLLAEKETATEVPVR